MTHRTDPEKVFCSNRPRQSKDLILESRMVWDTATFKGTMLHISLKLPWAQRMAVKTTTILDKAFCREFLNKFGPLLLPNTKNLTGKLISAGEKSVREELKYSYPFSITRTT